MGATIDFYYYLAHANLDILVANVLKEYGEDDPKNTPRLKDFGETYIWEKKPSSLPEFSYGHRGTLTFEKVDGGWLATYVVQDPVPTYFLDDESQQGRDEFKAWAQAQTREMQFQRFKAIAAMRGG